MSLRGAFGTVVPIFQSAMHSIKNLELKIHGVFNCSLPTGFCSWFHAFTQHLSSHIIPLGLKKPVFFSSLCPTEFWLKKSFSKYFWRMPWGILG